MDSILQAIVGTDQESLVACDYLLNTATDEDSLQALPFLSRTSFEALLELDFVGFQVMGVPQPSHGHSMIYLPEHFHGRYVLGILGLNHPPYMASMAIQKLQPGQWKPSYTTARFVYDKHKRMFCNFSRFGFTLTGGSASTQEHVHGSTISLIGMSPETGWSIQVRTYANGMLLGRSSVATRCSCCNSPVVLCSCPLSASRPKPLYAEPRPSWDQNRLFYQHALSDAIWRDFVDNVLVSGTVSERDYTLLGSLGNRASFELGEQSKRNLQACYPTLWIGPIFRVPYLEVNRTPDLPTPVLTTPGESPIKSNSCPVCRKEFVRKANVARHLQSVHAGARRFQCHICKFPFKHRHHLDGHMKSVHYHRTINCQICGAGVSSTSNLARHMRRVHQDADVHLEPSPPL